MFVKIFRRVSIILLAFLFVLGFSRSSGAATTVNTAAGTPPLINISKIPHPIALPPGSGTVVYNYTVLNIGLVPISDVALVDKSCPVVSFVSGDTNGNSMLDVNETWEYRCTTTISQTTTSSSTVTGQADGLSAFDTANATVFVGVPLPPPIIHLAILPSIFVLPAAGGTVTYSYAVSNPGPAPLSNIIVTDKNCSGSPILVSGNPGDINQNNILESNEVWKYTCQENLTQTTTNIGIAEGTSSGVTATDSSPATVVVSPVPSLPTTGSVPGLPNTGYPPQENNIPWTVILPSGILFVLFALYLGRKKIINN